MYTLAIALMGKGATNHLHKAEIVEAFHQKQVSVLFLVRSDYYDLIKKLPGCEYKCCDVNYPNQGIIAVVCNWLRRTRILYPARDKGKKHRFLQLLHGSGLNSRGKLGLTLQNTLAASKKLMRLFVYLEGCYYSRHQKLVDGVAASEIDQLLLMGFGAYASEPEGVLTWWAKGNSISVVHMMGNYDFLSSKGFRGVPITTFLVWGQSMREDATALQDIQPDCIEMVGSSRHNNLMNISLEPRHDFLTSLGLDPGKRTIVFAGSTYSYHYFEMLEVFRYHLHQDLNCQLILRIYPAKTLMNSPDMHLLFESLENKEDVYVSYGDPNFTKGDRGKDVLQIEEYELWNILSVSDLVINLFSSINIESCLYDVPTINMWYFPPKNKLDAFDAGHLDVLQVIHLKRLLSYQAFTTAFNRKQLVDAIVEAMSDPKALSKQRHELVRTECGPMDGKTVERLVNACVKARNNFCQQ